MWILYIPLCGSEIVNLLFVAAVYIIYIPPPVNVQRVMLIATAFQMYLI